MKMCGATSLYYNNTIDRWSLWYKYNYMHEDSLKGVGFRFISTIKLESHIIDTKVQILNNLSGKS